MVKKEKIILIKEKALRVNKIFLINNKEKKINIKTPQRVNNKQKKIIPINIKEKKNIIILKLFFIKLK